jgi:hypothetical protein
MNTGSGVADSSKSVRLALLCLAWFLLLVEGGWFFLGFMMAGSFPSKIWILFILWLCMIVAAAFFMKMPIALPILATINLLCSLVMVGSWSILKQYPTEVLMKNLPGVLLVLVTSVAYRFRPDSCISKTA